MTMTDLDIHKIKVEEAWRNAQSGKQPEDVIGFHIRALTHAVLAVAALLQEVRVAVALLADSAERSSPR